MFEYTKETPQFGRIDFTALFLLSLARPFLAAFYLLQTNVFSFFLIFT